MEKLIKEILVNIFVYVFIWIILFSIFKYNENAFNTIMYMLAIFFVVIKTKEISKWLLKNNE